MSKDTLNSEDMLMTPEEQLAEIHAILNEYGDAEAIKRIRALLYGEPDQEDEEKEVE